MHWLFLAIAAALEVGWIYSLKFSEGFTRLVPLVFYATCGLGAAFFLSLTLRHLPVGLTYAMWTGIAVIGSNLVAFTFLHEPFGLFRIICILLIAFGVAGLRLSV